MQDLKYPPVNIRLLPDQNFACRFWPFCIQWSICANLIASNSLRKSQAGSIIHLYLLNIPHFHPAAGKWNPETIHPNNDIIQYYVTRSYSTTALTWNLLSFKDILSASSFIEGYTFGFLCVISNTASHKNWLRTQDGVAHKQHMAKTIWSFCSELAIYKQLKSQKALAKLVVAWSLKDLRMENFQSDYSPIKIIDAFSKRRKM